LEVAVLTGDGGGAGGILHSVLSFFGRLSWIGKGATLGIAGAVSIAAQDVIRNPDEFGNRLGQLQAYQRLGGDKAGEIVLSAEAEANLDRMIRRIAEVIELQLLRPSWTEATGFVPWTVAQMTVSSAGLFELNKTAIERFVYKSMDPSCGCWRELADKPEHVGVSGWVLYSLGHVGLPIPEPAVTFLLDNQAADGWWPIYPATANDRHASTYATAWAILGLDKYQARSKAGLQPAEAERAQRVAEAIQRGVSWLRKTKITDEARWYDYPNYHTKVRALGVSGLVMYVLNQFSRDDQLEDVSRRWMRAVDGRVISSEETDSSDGSIERKNGAMAIDQTRHIRLPWALLATVKSFRYGSRWEQARALAWMERVLRSDVLSESVLSRYWVTSELLIALRELKASAGRRKLS